MIQSSGKMKKDIQNRIEKESKDKPVSLAPLTFNEALDGLLKTKPIKNETLKQKSRTTKKQSAKK